MIRSCNPSVIRSSTRDLTRFVRAAQGGDSRAVDDLLAAIRPSLVGYFARRVPLDAAEDLAQVTLIRVVGALHRIQPERADSYVARVAQNLLRTARWRQARDRRRYVSADQGNRIEGGDTSDADADYHELLFAVRRASARVLPRDLRVIVAAVLRGHTPAEIAAAQRVSPITIRTRLLRARALLRRELGSYLNPSPVAALLVRSEVADDAA
ncbi:MAG: sigma-70 family RNA polymerase sigma factor [Thermoleophilia bacterium]|nr:sigma-70 family RNA polymerase sigma factor [Thermoleophilia bacterium]